LLSSACEALKNAGEIISSGVKSSLELAALQWYLYTAHQNILDAVASIVSKLGFRKPGSYSELAHPLKERDLVSDEFANVVRVIARNRNRLAHAHMGVEVPDLKEMYEFLNRSMEVVVNTLTSICEKEEVNLTEVIDVYGIRGVAPSIGVEFIVLFGSRARGDYREDSDYDFAVYAGRKLSLKELDVIARALSEKIGVSLDKIDVVDLYGAPNELVYKVIRDGKPVYAENTEFYRKWVRREYVRILDEEDLMDTYNSRFYRKILLRSRE